MSAALSLTDEDRADYERHKATIREGLQTFIDVGLALADIHERRLYLLEYNSFEAFIQSEYGYTRQWAYQLMPVAQIAERVSTVVDRTPSQNFCRALKAVPEEYQVTVADLAAGKARAEERLPTSGDVERTWEMLDNAIRTGSANVGGEATAFDAELDEANREARQRQREHIDRSRHRKYVGTVTGTINHRSGNTLTITLDSSINVSTGDVVEITIKRILEESK